MEWDAKQEKKRKKLEKQFMCVKTGEEVHDKVKDRFGQFVRADETDSEESFDSDDSDIEEIVDKEGHITRQRKTAMMPLKCSACGEGWDELIEKGKNPVATSCNHYFCEGCYMEAFAGNLDNDKSKIDKEAVEKERLE